MRNVRRWVPAAGVAAVVAVVWLGARAARDRFPDDPGPPAAHTPRADDEYRAAVEGGSGLELYRKAGPDRAADAFRGLAAEYTKRAGGHTPARTPEATAAVEDLRRLVDLHAARLPADPTAAVYRAYLLLADEKYADAADAFERAAAGLPVGRPWETARYTCRWCRARSLVLTGEAVAAYDRTPADRRADLFWSCASLLLRDTGRAATLGELLARRRADAPDSPLREWVLAWHEYDGGRYVAAVRAAERTLKLLGDDRDGRRTLVNELDARRVKTRALARLGRFTEAVTHLDGTSYSLYGQVTLTATWTEDALLVALLAGDGDRVGELLATGEWKPSYVYADKELGPLLRSDPRLAGVRAKYPPPAE